MSRPKLSRFPLDRPFEKTPVKTDLSQIALRLVVNFHAGNPIVVGTATVICGHLLITAKHVFEEILRIAHVEPQGGYQQIHNDICAVQLVITEEIEYLIWDITSSILDPCSDIALLQLTSNPSRSHLNRPLNHRSPILAAFPPNVGETVAAFGYRQGRIEATTNDNGGRHIQLDDEPMMSVGVIREIYEWKRDSALLTFPCYRVGARFDGGMSGGPVFDETGSLCGIVCSNVDGSHEDGEPISYVSTLWPLFRLILPFDRGDRFPRGIHYPAIELARGGQVGVSDLARLERWFAQHIR